MALGILYFSNYLWGLQSPFSLSFAALLKLGEQFHNLKNHETKFKFVL